MSSMKNIGSLLMIHIGYHKKNLIILPVGVMAAKAAGPLANALTFIFPLLLLEKYFISEVTERIRSFRYILPVSRSQIVFADFLFLILIIGIVSIFSLVPLDLFFGVPSIITITSIPAFLSSCCLLILIFNVFGYNATLSFSLLLFMGILVSSLLKINPFSFFISGAESILLLLAFSLSCFIITVFGVNRKKYNPVKIAKEL